jgi:hypothetical protein
VAGGTGGLNACVLHSFGSCLAQTVALAELASRPQQAAE